MVEYDALAVMVLFIDLLNSLKVKHIFHLDKEMHLTKTKQLIVFHVSKGLGEADSYLRMSTSFYNVTVLVFLCVRACVCAQNVSVQIFPATGVTCKCYIYVFCMKVKISMQFSTVLLRICHQIFLTFFVTYNLFQFRKGCMNKLVV